MGGTMACGYAQKYTDKVEGVVIWASFPGYINRLDDKDLKVISIYGTKDGDVEGIEASADRLPPDTQWVPIEGGNHTQCGWYDTSPDSIQPGDNPADITREEQQDQMIQATVGFLKQFAISPAPLTCTAEKIYGVYSEKTELLRFFRDNVLSETQEGQEIIRLYYQWSPVIVMAMQNDEEFRKAVKELIDGILPVIRVLAK